MKKLIFTQFLALVSIIGFAQGSGNQVTYDMEGGFPGGLTVSPNTGTRWFQTFDVSSNVAYIVQENVDGQADSLTTPDITVPGDPDSQTQYTWSFSFDWRNSNFEYTAGGTNGTLGSGSVGNGYNYSDVIVQYFNGTSWVNVWYEDRKDTLKKAVKVSDLKTPFVWPDFTKSSELTTINSTWYRSTINLPSGIKSRSDFKIRVIYKSNNYPTGGNRYFYVDNIQLKWRGPYPGPTGGSPVIEVSNLISTPYRYIPYSQVNPAGYDFKPTIKNNGWNLTSNGSLVLNFTSGSSGNKGAVDITSPLSTYASRNLSKIYTFNPLKSVDSEGTHYSNTSYTYNYSFTGATASIYDKNLGNPSSVNGTFEVHPTRYQKENGGQGGYLYIGDSLKYNSRVGVEFDIINKDHLDNVYFYLSSSGGYYDFILADKNGSEIYRSNNTQFNSTGYTSKSPRDGNNKPFLLDPAMSPYRIFIEQNGSTPVQVAYDSNKGSFLYNSISSPSKDTLYGDLRVYLNLVSNTEPQLESGSTSVSLQAITAGDHFNIKQFAKDADKESVKFWLRKDTTPSTNLKNYPTWKAGTNVPSWINITDNNDTSFTISGTPTNAHVGTNNFTVIMTDGYDTSSVSYSIVVNPATTSFTQEGQHGMTVLPTGWYQINSKTSNNHWTFGSEATVTPENKDQDEWMVSRGVYLPALTGTTTDTAYYLSFNWKNDWNKNSAAAVEAQDLADAEVYISDNYGKTWTTIWSDDDSALVKNTKHYTTPTTSNWPYVTNTQYYFGKDISSYAGKSVVIAFRYKGKNGGNFYIDNVLIQRLTSASISVYPSNAYYRVPYRQRSAQKFNMGVKGNNIPQNVTANYSSRIDYNSNAIYNGNVSLTPVKVNDTVRYTFNESFTHALSMSYYPVTYTIQNYRYLPDYTFGVNPVSLATTSVEFQVTKDEYAIVSPSSYSGVMYYNTYNTDGLGVEYEFVTNDRITAVKVFDLGANWNYNFTLYRINGSNYEQVATLDNFIKSSFTDTYSGYVYALKSPVNVTPGKYIIMVNRVNPSQDAYIGFYNQNNPNNKFNNVYKRSGNNVVKILTKEMPKINLVLGNNTPTFTPALSSLTTTQKTGYANVLYSQSLNVNDLNGDAIGVVANGITNGSQYPGWLTATISNNVVTLSGTADTLNIGNHSVKIALTDGRDTVSENFTLTIKANPSPEFSSAPVTTVKAGSAYTYNVSAKDQFGDALTLTADEKPSWLTFTANNTAKTAILSGTPTAAQAGSSVVKLKVLDANGRSAFQLFTVLVSEVSGPGSNQTPQTNAIPVFTSIPGNTAKAGTAFTYNVTATDANTDPLTISIAPGTPKPSWLSFTATGSSANLSGTPTTSDVGSYRIVLVVSDGKGSSTQTVNISVQPANAAPAISSSANTAAESGASYSYNITATDADGQILTIKTVKKPTWLTLYSKENGKATLSGTPGNEHVGSQLVTIAVSDGYATVEQSFTITVTAKQNTAPSFSSSGSTSATTGVKYSVTVIAADSEGSPVRFSAKKIPVWLSLVDKLDNTAILSGTPGSANIGNNEVVLTATDGELVTEQKFTIKVVAGASGSTKNAQVQAYPNPSSGEIKVEVPAEGDIYVFDSNGSLAAQFKGVKDVNSIDLSMLNSGTYLLKIVTSDGNTTQKTISIVK